MTRIHVCCVVNFTRKWREFLARMKRVNSKCSSVQLRANSAIYSRHSRLVWTHLYWALSTGKCIYFFIINNSNQFTNSDQTMVNTKIVLGLSSSHPSIHGVINKLDPIPDLMTIWSVLFSRSNIYVYMFSVNKTPDKTHTSQRHLFDICKMYFFSVCSSAIRL